MTDNERFLADHRHSTQFELHHTTPAVAPRCDYVRDEASRRVTVRCERCDELAGLLILFMSAPHAVSDEDIRHAWRLIEALTP